MTNLTPSSFKLTTDSLSEQTFVPSAAGLDPQVCDQWSEIAELWEIRPGTTYLNHGSFGISPRPVREIRRAIIDQLDRQPMDFYVRDFEGFLNTARSRMAEFVGTQRSNLVFVDNATYGMNVVADSFPLQAGDEVLLNNHEYGAVQRIWQRRAERCGARVEMAELPHKIESVDQVVECLLEKTTEKTRLAVFSHITSPTAIILPVRELCRAFQQRGIATCIDGPHAPLHVDLNISEIGCDFYTASCHKWLCATLGTGFCFMQPKWHEWAEPVLKSWGRLPPAMPQTWDEEFTWPGTRDPSAYLSIPAAIETAKSIGIQEFRNRSYAMARYAVDQLVKLTGQDPIAPRDWYGCMGHVPLPDGNHSDLQNWLWTQHEIEVPIVDFLDRWHVRISCHLYNRFEQIDKLVKALADYLE